MQRFRYTARNIDGRNTTGEVVAFSREEAASRLQEAGVYVTSVVPIREGRRFFRQGPGSIPLEEMLVFLESWAMFLEAGLSMQSALLRLRVKTRIPAMARAVEEMQAAIDRGASVTEALKESRLLPASWVPVVEIGEKKGDFVEPLKTLYRYSMEFRRFKHQLLTEMIMPFILMGVMALWFWLLFNRILPSFMLLMASVGGALEVPTLLVLVSKVFVGCIRWVAPAAIALLLILFFWLRRLNQEMGLSQMWLPTWTPIVGSIIAQMQLIIVASGLQLQMEAGISFLNAIESLSRSVRSRAMRRDLLQVYGKLREGVSIPESIIGMEVIPPTGQALLVAGYHSGKMPEMLAHLVKETELVLLEEVKRLAVLIRSAVIITAGITVGIFVIAFFMLLFSAFGSLSHR